jgi:hypothetical protein
MENKSKIRNLLSIFNRIDATEDHLDKSVDEDEEKL